MKTWVKLYTEINRDPKMAELTWAQRGIWAALLGLAGELDIRNGDGSETGELDTIENTAWRIRCESGFEETVEALKGHRMVHEEDGVLFISNYAKRQARPPSARPQATRERKRRQRARESQEHDENVTRGSQPVTPSESESDQSQRQIQKRSESESEPERDASLRSPPPVRGFKRVTDLISSQSPDPDQKDQKDRAPPGFTSFTAAKQEQLVVRHLQNAQQRPLDDDQLNTVHRLMCKEKPNLALEMAQRTNNGKRKDNAVGYWISCLKKNRGPP